MSYQESTDRQVEHLTPPQSIETERAVLGSILKDKEAMSVVLEVFEDSATLYNDKHRLIFEAALALYTRSDPCDIVTIAEELNKRGHLERVGNRTYLVELAEGVASTANVESHARIILDKSLLRQLINTSNTISRSCYTLDEPVQDILDSAESQMFAIAETQTRQGFVEATGRAALERMEMIASGGVDGVRTGFAELDKLTLGLHDNELTILAGRPSMGKTALAVNIAQNVSKNIGVGIFSIEMSLELLETRLLCGRENINIQKTSNGYLTTEEFDRLKREALQNIHIDDSPTLSILEARAKARRLCANYEIGLIIIDYIQLMHGTGENRQVEISRISRGCKALAKELHIPILGISQLSRAVEGRADKIPMLSDLRESGAIEQDADVVMFVHRPEYYLTEAEKAAERNKPAQESCIGDAQVIVAKQRNGPTGTIKLAFDGRIARFGDVAEPEAPLDDRYNTEMPL